MMSLTQPDTRDIVLSEREWRQRVAEHAARVEPWVTPRLARREQGERHPVDDFLFDYYSWRPAQLARWHPGAGVILDGDVRDFEGVRGYAVDGAGARVDHATMTVDVMRGALGLLEATAARPAAYHCFGRSASTPTRPDPSIPCSPPVRRRSTSSNPDASTPRWTSTSGASGRIRPWAPISPQTASTWRAGSERST
jgi:hypothetical protein